MTIGNDVIRGALKLDSFLEGQCFVSWSAFIQAIPSMFSVELPAEVTNVTIGNQAPSDDDRDHLWIKTDGSGSFLGLYLYMSGAWQQIYPVPNQIFLLYGDSRYPPPGYTLVSNDPGISSAMLANLKKMWVVGGTSPDWWTMYHATYTGF